MTAAGLRKLGMVAMLLVFGVGCRGNAGDSAAPQAAVNESAPPDAAAEQERGSAGAQRGSQVELCEHRVPAELCTKCNPDLVPAFKETGDWCNEHGVPESHCYECNPKLTFAANAEPSGEAWCNEHGVPEAKCTKCKPQLIAKFIESADFCREHGLPESVCPYCHPEVVKAAGHELPIFPSPGTKVRLANLNTELEAGIQYVPVRRQPFAETLDVVGHIEFNQNRLAKLSARGDGLVVGVKVDIGDDVKKGQPLVVLVSGTIGQGQSTFVAAKAQLDVARASLERGERLQQSGIASTRSVEQARAEVAAAKGEYDGARAALRSAGAGEASSGGQYVLTAPFDGTVVAREAVAGKSVSADTPLIQVADLRTMWAMLGIPEDVSSSVRVDQRVTLALDGLHGETREATLGRMSAAVDPHTRTVEARVDLPNPDRALRAGLFVRAKIQVAAEHDALLVPAAAVQRAQGTPLVFVRNGPGQYDAVPVELGARTAELVEIRKGLTAGANVVTTGAFMLKTEILKDSIGAGCADD